VERDSPPRARRRAAAYTDPSRAGGLGIIGATVAAAALVAKVAGLLVATAVNAGLTASPAAAAGRAPTVSVSPTAAAIALRAGGAAFADWTPVAVVALALALCWPAAIGGAHFLARALARR